jgi:hypothetical protein
MLSKRSSGVPRDIRLSLFQQPQANMDREATRSILKMVEFGVMETS